MLGDDWIGPFYVWDSETEEEKKEAMEEIDQLNQSMAEEVERKNKEWKNSDEFRQLKATELAAAKEQQSFRREGQNFSVLEGKEIQSSKD